MNSDERAYKEYDASLVKLQKLLKHLSFLLSRDSGYAPQPAQGIVNNPAPKANFNEDEPRDRFGRWTVMNIDKAVRHIDAHSLPLKDYRKLPKEKQGKCAEHVRQAIQAGGVQLKPEDSGYPHAENYRPYLEKYKFKKVTPEEMKNYLPDKGDIAVFQPPTKTTNMAIYKCIMEKFGFLISNKQMVFGRDKITEMKVI